MPLDLLEMAFSGFELPGVYNVKGRLNLIPLLAQLMQLQCASADVQAGILPHLPDVTATIISVSHHKINGKDSSIHVCLWLHNMASL